MGFNGLYASSPFNHPQASAVVTLYGGEDVIKQLGGSKLNLKPVSNIITEQAYLCLTDWIMAGAFSCITADISEFKILALSMRVLIL